MADTTGVHKTHCCVVHGCKYGSSHCPVELKLTIQEGPCEIGWSLDEVCETPEAVRERHIKAAVDELMTRLSESWSTPQFPEDRMANAELLRQSAEKERAVAEFYFDFYKKQAENDLPSS